MKVSEVPRAMEHLFDWYHSGKPFKEFELLISDHHLRIRMMLLDTGIMLRDGSASADYPYDQVVYSILLYLCMMRVGRLTKK